MAESFITKSSILEFLKDLPEDTVFAALDELDLSDEQDWSEYIVAPISSINSCQSNGRTTVIFGIDNRGVI